MFELMPLRYYNFPLTRRLLLLWFYFIPGVFDDASGSWSIACERRLLTCAYLKD